MEAWFAEHWLDLIETVCVVGGLCFTAVSLRSGTKTQRITNLLSITSNHREVWNSFLNHKRLARVLDASANTSKQPITEAESIFVTMVIGHVSSVYYAMNDQLVINLAGLRRDIAQLLSLPIPREVWENIKDVQNEDIVAFIESCRNCK